MAMLYNEVLMTLSKNHTNNKQNDKYVPSFLFFDKECNGCGYNKPLIYTEFAYVEDLYMCEECWLSLADSINRKFRGD